MIEIHERCDYKQTRLAMTARKGYPQVKGQLERFHRYELRNAADKYFWCWIVWRWIVWRESFEL